MPRGALMNLFERLNPKLFRSLAGRNQTIHADLLMLISWLLYPQERENSRWMESASLSRCGSFRKNFKS